MPDVAHEWCASDLAALDFYYFTVKDYPNIFVGSSQISNQLPLTTVGDRVKISFDLDTEEIIDVSQFENLSLKK